MEADARGAAPARGIAWSVLVAIAGGAMIAVFGGPAGVTLGLVVVAVLIGRFVTLALLAGAGATMTPRTRTVAAVVVAVLGVLLGQVGIWLYARSEGGVLDLVDYLAEAFGWLVALQLIVAAVVAWATAR